MADGEQASSLDKVNDTIELENGMECAPDAQEKGVLHCENPDGEGLIEVDASNLE